MSIPLIVLFSLVYYFSSLCLNTLNIFYEAERLGNRNRHSFVVMGPTTLLVYSVILSNRVLNRVLFVNNPTTIKPNT